jgi:hypothetical protein
MVNERLTIFLPSLPYYLFERKLNVALDHIYKIIVVNLACLLQIYNFEDFHKVIVSHVHTGSL